ncbi:nitrous oxide reductase family maturation protein NosD [Rhodoblastus acidophilus]|uniref:Nitrous oxide reductase family maturation protein NosD n=1 Tax=Candidatus Rhodoblastus alkanivorans TaxID=2954117 RepID=A0ABS9Z278_9HYPH|nr:nitrous oxide reductase family maturation protein NosD [Candidatus Rhodoblastus alkanivorans]MCI4677416.1 nitrous oxide reductase family maturation protein NosD [Candidatus Rhodoblastus alkanivorans]MCI4681775.1 nitrous oxide reductase family maturation protein NosD [Candidatus Rhodoblastus alkanivorans]MDI4642824.1 nitrous oxide reductase family maturation protein NosD [Rhodoblastus acidophilus]
MRRARSFLLIAAVVAAAAGGARAADIAVPAGGGLAEVVARAAPGDVLHLASGAHPGAVVIATPRLTLEGEPGAIVDGQGKGSAVTIRAPGVTLRGLTITGSGLSLFDKDSGVFIDRGADHATVIDNHFENDLIGVYLDGPKFALVEHNRIDGLRTMRLNERGPGVEVFDTPGSRIIDNDFSYGRDGVFSVNSRDNEVRGNRFRDLRFAVHFMYTNNSSVIDNVSVGNDIGYAMMYSDRLIVMGNASARDREHGLLFNYANNSLVENNAVRTSDKCVFIYNSNKNRFSGNWFQGCNIGIHFTAGSEQNQMTGNSFVNSRTQVMYVGTTSLDWSVKGRGNYYSDNPAFDLNGDGIADAPYRPNDLMDQVIWRAPEAKLLLNSPAVQIVRWAQARFPAIHPGGVFDSAPLMKPLPPPALKRLNG